MQDELAAHRAFQTGSAHECEQLLVERAVDGYDLHHKRLKTPITFPRI